MRKKRILFVDDEPNILSGLKRMLRSMRKEFDLQFAGSGIEALDSMAVHESDIVVSDMRMPGMDGAELLDIIQERYPSAVRIMFTGQADQESVLRTVGVVHQFLTKPCDSDLLRSVLLRAGTLHRFVSDTSICGKSCGGSP